MDKTKTLLFVAVAVFAVFGEEVNSEAELLQKEQEQYFGATTNTALGVVAEQLMSQSYGSVMLNFQTSYAWVQAAQMIHRLNMLRLKSHSSEGRVRILEEGDEASEAEKMRSEFTKYVVKSLETEKEYMQSSFTDSESEINALDKGITSTIMRILRIQTIATINRLDVAQATHAQAQLVMTMLQASAATNPQAPMMLWLMYMRDITQTLKSSQNIQKLDSWVLWNTLESLEVSEFDVNMPEELTTSIKHAYATAMKTQLADSTMDLQLFFIDYYISASAMAAAPAAPAPAAPAAPAAAPPAGAPAIFLEVEEKAQPSKPFFGPQNPQFMMYYVFMMKMYAKFIFQNAAMLFNSEAQAEIAPNLHEPQMAEYSKNLPMIRVQASGSLLQWSQMMVSLSYMDMFMMFGGGSPTSMTPNHNAAAFNNFVQTDAPVEQQQQQQPQVQVPVQVQQPQELVQEFAQPQIPVIQNENFMMPQAQQMFQSVVG